MFEAVYDTWTMLKDAVTWWVILEALFFTVVFSSVTFVGIYIFIIELPGMFINFVIGSVERIFARLWAKQNNFPTPMKDADVYHLSKNPKCGFITMLREVRILVNQWFLLIQNGSAVILFFFIWGAIVMYFFYAISEGATMSNGATLLNYANELLEVMPYTIILLMVVGLAWGGYTTVASAWKFYEFFLFKEALWKKDPFAEMKITYRNRNKKEQDE